MGAKYLSASAISLGALCIALSSATAWSQPATVAPQGTQPAVPTSEATTPATGPDATTSATPDSGSTGSGEFLNAIVVTGSRQGKTLMQSSNSVTSLNTAQITQFTPRSEADVLHLIPGIRVESTAGAGGNSNITVRGLPLASGGSKYVQLQENGIPNVEFGDIAFGNNDYWQRYDYTVDTVQAVRGGNASTGASQAPGAIINYIEKTGLTAGGKIGLSTGIGYDDKRVDFDYGAPINDTTRFNIGGFYRHGDGPRSLSYNAEDGYQIKANATKTFNDGAGYIRVNFKRLDDRAPTYTSMPFGVKVSGDKITGYYPLAGFDARKDTSFSTNNLSFPVVQPDGSVTQGSNREGIHSKSTTAGGEFHDDFGTHFSVDDRVAYTWNSGTFSVPFYGSLSSVSALTTPGGAGQYSVTTAGGTTYRATQARYANGANAGQIVAGNVVVNQNPTLNTTMNNMNHFGNDLAFTGKFDVLAGKIVAKAGWYHYHQNVDMDWHWNGSLVDAGSGNVARINLYDATGTALTDNGLTGYNTGFGGFNRHYDLHYAGDAPYGSVNYQDDHFDLDGSVRFDRLDSHGEFYNTAATKSTLDVNGDGVLSVAEQNVYRNSGVAQRIDYQIHYTSWSVGGNYRFTRNTAVFIRGSQGYRANADRIVSDFAGAFNADGSLTAIGKAVAVNPVTQQEVGIKQRGNVMDSSYGLFLTAFRSQATEYNFDLTRPAGQQQTFQKYRTWGLELESQLSHGPFALNSNLVYTHSRISKDLIGNNTGNVPLATPDLMWTISPTVNLPLGSLGFTILGQTSSHPQNDNVLTQKGYTTVNAFLLVHPLRNLPKLSLSVNVANLFNVFDQSGRLDQGSVADLASTGALYGVPYAATNRVGFGRTVSGSVSFEF